MPELYERLSGTEPERVGPKIPLEVLFACIGEEQSQTMTVAQSNEIIRRLSSDDGDPLGPISPLCRQEIADLIATLPGGTTSANIGSRAQRMNEVRRVLILAENTVLLGLAPLATTAAVRTRLGVPTR